MRLRSIPATALLLAALLAVFLLEVVRGGSENPGVLVALGANAPLLVRRGGQVWRLAACLFLHIGVWHLLVNAWALYQLGGLFETWMGPLRLLAVFFVAGIAGSCATVLWNQAHLSAGASGAIFGLLGALIAFLLRRRDRLTPMAKSLLRQLVFWAAINVVLGFSIAGIDNAAHLGGCAAGLLLGVALPEPRRFRPVGPASPPDPADPGWAG